MDPQMEPRAPDVYSIDQLVENEPDQEVELAKLASLESYWASNKASRDKWSNFQPLLEHVKRVGAFDKTIQQVYDLLSILLYQYAYGIDADVPIDTLDLIEHRVRSIRLPDKEKLQEVMDHLRSSL